MSERVALITGASKGIGAAAAILLSRHNFKVAINYRKSEKEAKRVLIEHKVQLTELAESLLEKEVIFKEDLVRIFGERPGEETSKYEPNKVEDTEGE